MNIMSLDQLGFEAFAPLVKTKWLVEPGTAGALELELAAVTPRRLISSGGAGGVTYEQFALELLGPNDRLLPQRIYWFEAPALGRFELFIVPVGRDAQGIRYEAAFNRPVPAQWPPPAADSR